MSFIRKYMSILSLLFLVSSANSMDLSKFFKKKLPDQIEMKTFRDHTSMGDDHNIVHSFLHEPIVYQSIWEKLPKDVRRHIAKGILERAPLMLWVTEKCVLPYASASFAFHEMMSNGEMACWPYPKILEGYFSPTGDKVALTIGGEFYDKPFSQKGIKLFDISKRKWNSLGSRWETVAEAPVSDVQKPLGSKVLVERGNSYCLQRTPKNHMNSNFPGLQIASVSMRSFAQDVCAWQEDEEHGLDVLLVRGRRASGWGMNEKEMIIRDSSQPNKPFNTTILECSNFLLLDPTGTKAITECPRGYIRIYDLSNLQKILKYFKKEILLEHVILLNCIRWTTSRLAKKFDFNKLPHLKGYYDSLPVEVKDAIAGVVTVPK